MIIGIHCIIYWSTLIREGGKSKQERYTILLEKQSQLTPKHHFLPQTATLFCQGGCEKTHYGPVKDCLSLGTYLNLLQISILPSCYHTFGAGSTQAWKHHRKKCFKKAWDSCIIFFPWKRKTNTVNSKPIKRADFSVQIFLFCTCKRINMYLHLGIQ